MIKNLCEDMQLTLPNVAAVPQYSPFRYPGGKSRWYPFVKQWMLSARPKTFVEPFAGGAHAGLAVGIEELSEEVVLVEIDDNVAAVWKTILQGDVKWLKDRIRSFEMNRENAEEMLALKDRSPRDRAFATIVHNRVSRGGTTAPGAGWLKKGENGKGLSSRWYPDTLVDRIQEISKAKDRIDFIHEDGMEVLRRYLCSEEVAIFIDPPYPKTGDRLYEHSAVDHEAIFELAVSASGHVLLTYDDSEEVKKLVRRLDMQSEELVVSTTHHTEKKELLIGKDLGWIADL
jgi:DNA adenine methylase